MRSERRVIYATLWMFALAFGWIEAAAVVYLREISLRETSLQPASAFAALQVTLVSLPNQLIAIELVREACTIVLLGAIAWLGGRSVADRTGAFLLAFGIWDVTYYAVLKVVTNWPDSLSAWDILFLIPLPWVAPVWAPVTVASLFIAAGSYLFWTARRERRYGWLEIAALIAAALLTIVAFLARSDAASEHRIPDSFPAWLFWSGVALGTATFVLAERRAVRRPERKRPWVGVRVRSVLPALPAAIGGARIVEHTAPELRGEADKGGVISAYRDAKRQHEALLKRATDLADRFERLGHGLAVRPAHTIVGLPDVPMEDSTDWNIVPDHPLPSIGDLTTLCNDIRAAAARVDDLTERLILTGHVDVVEKPDAFFR